MATALGRPISYEEMESQYSIVVGTPQTVTKKLKYVLERLNPGHLLIFGCDSPMPHRDIMRSIELMGKEVIPALHQMKLSEYYESAVPSV